MVTRPPFLPFECTPVLRAALSARLEEHQISSFVHEMRALAQQESALSLRLAMVLACLKQFDLAEIGYSGFLAFCRERVEWGSSWLRALVRLVESPLEQIKAAAAEGQIPLRLAVLTPGRVSVEEQAAWLGGAVLSPSPPQRPRCTIHGPTIDIVEQARALARLCIGHDAPVSRLDEYILRHWREHVPGSALEEARTPPSAPEPRILDFGWAEGEPAHSVPPEDSTPISEPTRASPAEELLGPWRAPESLHEALTQLQAVQAVRRGRVATLSRAFALIHYEALWYKAGFASPWEFAEDVLGWSRRTAQRHRKLGWALEWYPQLDAAVREGFSPTAAARIGWLSDRDPECNRWLALARHLGSQELLRATSNDGERLTDYERALDLARRHADALLGPDGPGSHPSGTLDVYRVKAPDLENEGATPAGTGPRDPLLPAMTAPGSGGLFGTTTHGPSGTATSGHGPATSAASVYTRGLTTGSSASMASCPAVGAIRVSAAGANTASRAGTGSGPTAGQTPPAAPDTASTPPAGTGTSTASAQGAGTGASAAGTGASNDGAHPRVDPAEAPPGEEVRIRISLPRAAPGAAGADRPTSMRVHPDLPEAARWFVANNQPRPLSGFSAVKQRAHHRCENPECGRPTLRLEAHHVHWRRFGGADDPANAVGLCPSCHLRGVHTRDERIRVTRVNIDGLEALWWEYPGRTPVLQFREPPPASPPVPHPGQTKQT